jgi:hypothetical protein
MAPAGPMPRRRRSLSAASPSRRPTRSRPRGGLGSIRRRLASRRRLNVRRGAIVPLLRRLDPIDRSSRLVGPINPDGVAALAQAGKRGRVVCGSQPVAATSSARVAPSPRCSSSTTCAILVPPRGDVGVEATPLFGLSKAAAGPEPGSGFGSTEGSGPRSASPSDGPLSSTAIAFAPAAVSLSA